MTGHGPVVTLDYVQTQRAHLMAWQAAVADAVAMGRSREETIARVWFNDQFGPVDVGQRSHDGSLPEQQRRLARGQVHRDGLLEGALTRKLVSGIICAGQKNRHYAGMAVRGRAHLRTVPSIGADGPPPQNLPRRFRSRGSRSNAS